MDAIVLQATVTADRRLIVDLPSDVPVGAVTVTIQPTEAGDEQRQGRKSLTREEARRRLVAANFLVTDSFRSETAATLTVSEAEQLGHLFADDNQTIGDLVNEDREPRC